MEGGETLLIPGPVSVEPAVLEALSRPIRAHYGEDWGADYTELCARLARLFATQGEVLLVFGPGSAALEAALASTLGRGDEVIVASNGIFGERLAAVGRALGLVVHPLEAPPGAPLELEAMEAALRRHPAARAFAVVHHETSTGVLNPVRELCRLAHERGLLTVVDAISSFAGVELEVDAWGIDLCVSVANKCLGGPIGVAPLAVAPRTWEVIEDGRPKAAGWYLNLRTWREARRVWGDHHPHPVTMPTSIIEALRVAVAAIEAIGPAGHRARLAEAAKRVRSGLRELGFEMLVDDRSASPVTTAVRALPGMDVGHYLGWLRHRRGLRVGGGLGPLAGRIFRVGHMGRAAEPAVVEAYLAATAEYLASART